MEGKWEGASDAELSSHKSADSYRALVMVRAINRSIKTSRCEKSEAELANASRDFLKRTRRRLMEALEWEILKSN